MHPPPDAMSLEYICNVHKYGWVALQQQLTFHQHYAYIGSFSKGARLWHVSGRILDCHAECLGSIPAGTETYFLCIHQVITFSEAFFFFLKLSHLNYQHQLSLFLGRYKLSNTCSTHHSLCYLGMCHTRPEGRVWCSMWLDFHFIHVMTVMIVTPSYPLILVLLCLRLKRSSLCT